MSYLDEDNDQIDEEDDEEQEDVTHQLHFRITELLPNTEQAMLKK